MKNGSELKIGQRITYAWHEDALTVIIHQRITSSQQMMLDAWFAAWLLVGGSLGYAYTQSQGEEQNFLLICLAFWTFFAIRVLKVLAWRRVGREMIRVNAEGMSIKNAFGNYGKAKFFIKSNIKRMEVLRRDPSKFMHNLDQSFWIMGGDSLQFNYLRSRFVLGKQLNERDAKALAQLFDKALRKFK
ncbi:hypothetical protein N9L13_05940 [Flavobacteriales bacterium]|jgi:hypothetical protein|nr:hypothetical protein [Flavobacteriales bacterium]